MTPWFMTLARGSAWRDHLLRWGTQEEEQERRLGWGKDVEEPSSEYWVSRDSSQYQGHMPMELELLQDAWSPKDCFHVIKGRPGRGPCRGLLKIKTRGSIAC